MELLLNHRRFVRLDYFFPRKRWIVLFWHLPLQGLRRLYVWVYFSALRTNRILLWLMKIMQGLLWQLYIKSQTNTVTGFLTLVQLRSCVILYTFIFIYILHLNVYRQQIVWEWGEELSFNISVASRHLIFQIVLQLFLAFLYCIFFFVTFDFFYNSNSCKSQPVLFLGESGCGSSHPEELKFRMQCVQNKVVHLPSFRRK